MMQTPTSRCDCCGLSVSPEAGEDCPRCNYPISASKEERFLESAIRDIRRVTTYGGANLTVAALLRRYQLRLDYLRRLKVTGAPTGQFAKPPEQVAPAARPSEVVPTDPSASPYEPSASIPYVPPARVVPPVSPVAPVGRAPEVAPIKWSAPPAPKPAEALPPRPPVAPVAGPTRIAPAVPPVAPKPAEALPPRPPVAPVAGPARVTPVTPPVAPKPAAPVRERQSVRKLVFSWAAFFVDNAITVIGLLGAFLILIGTLGFVYSNTISGNRPLSFLLVFLAHAGFGIGGIIAYRFANFRLIARIYIIIYALLLPLAGWTAYNLISGNSIQLSVQALIAIAAAYATIVYAALAIYQGSAPFGYLAVVALAVLDLAVAQVLRLHYGWWPSTLMPMALLAFVTVVPTSSAFSSERIFSGRLAVLREPLRILMFIIVGVCAVGIVVATLLSFLPGGFLNIPPREIRFSILSMTLLLLLWTSLYMWLTRSSKRLLVLAYLLLASALALCYALEFRQVGYALMLTGVAVLYHGLNRFAPHLLQSFGKLGLRLDQLALVLVSVVPLISMPLLPLLLPFKMASPEASGTALLYPQMIPEVVGELIAMTIGLMLTISVALSRAGLRGTSDTQRNAWPWLLLLSGALLNWTYGTLVLILPVAPVWCFFGLTLALVASAVVVRQRFGSYWANPLDVLVLAETILTLSLGLGQPDILWIVLLLFAALSYGVLLYQRRQNWLFLPVAFALLAFPLLTDPQRRLVLLLMGFLLPLAAVAIRRLRATPLFTLSSGLPTNQPITFGWEWPLLTVGLLSGIVVSFFDVIFSTSAVQGWFHVIFPAAHVTFPAALEMAAFSLAWYVSAALARIKWWLLPVIGFAIAALLQLTNPFWVLAGVTFVSAVVALGISRFAGRVWASPLYIVTLLSALMTGIAGHTQNQLPATTSVLLAFAALFYLIGVVEDWTPWLWIMPIFATWSLIDSAALLGNLLRPPVLVLICAATGVAIGLLKLFASRTNRFARYVLPFYTTAFVAAVLTGVYGTLSGPKSVHLFTGDVPVALLLYAAVAYSVLLFERQPKWLWLVAGFATWGTLLATQTAAYDVVAIGILLGIVGLLLSRVVKLPGLNAVISASGYDLVKFTWGWPWYATALVAAIITGAWPALSPVQPVPGFIEYSLLGFAVLFYIIGVIEDQVSWLWLAPALATWSLIDSAQGNDLIRLVTVTLLCATLGVATGVLNRIKPTLFGAVQGNKRLMYALPFYATALVAAVLTGIDVTFSGIHPLFYGAFPAVLLLYAAVAYGVLLFERQPWWLGLVAGFAIWGTVLALQTTVYYVLGIGIGAGLVGLVMGRVVKPATASTVTPAFMPTLIKFTWGWPWYATALVAAVATGASAPLSVATWALLGFAALAYIIGVVEDFVPCLWLAPVFATWSLIDSVLVKDFSRLFIVALTCAALGVATGVLNRIKPSLFGAVQGNKRLMYALPFYATALVAAVLTGIDVSFSGIHPLFYGAFPAVLLLYAAVAYGVLLFERQPWWLGLVAGFAIWGIVLALQTTDVYYVLGIGIGAGLVGLVMGRVMKPATASTVAPAFMTTLIKFTWGWPWYATALVAAVATGASAPLSVATWALLGFAALAYIIGVVEDFVPCLWLAPAFATWSLIDSFLQPDFSRLPTAALICAVVGVAMSNLNCFIPQFRASALGNSLFKYALPFYATALVAAVLTGIDGVVFGLTQPFYGFTLVSGTVPAALLLYAVVAYGVLLFERRPEWLLLAPAFATWSLIDSFLQPDFSRLPTVALTCAVVGVAISSLKRFTPQLKDSALGNSLFKYALPFYATALVAAVLTGIDGTLNIKQSFYGVTLVFGTIPVVPAALLLYAVVAYAVLLFERRPAWLWLIAAFAFWGMLLMLQQIYSIVGIGIGAGLIGVLVGRLMKRPQVPAGMSAYMQALARFTWNWPWYATSLVAAAVTSVWPFLHVEPPAEVVFVLYGLLAFVALSVVMMLVERIPEALVFPIGLGGLVVLVAWGTGHNLAPWQLALTLSLLCVLIFASQFVWKVLPPATNLLPATLLHRIFGLGGQALVVLVIIGQGGLSATTGPLAHVGAGALLVLALLLFWYGFLQDGPTLRHWCYYAAGLLLSLVVPWELLAFVQTNLSLLTLAPASYLIVVAPFLMRDESLPAGHRIGQALSILGAALLLLPTLWLSFSEVELILRYTLIVLGESVVLLLLGFGMRVRIFVLGGAGLIVVAGLHALFLSTGFGPLALAGVGLILLLVATGLTLARHQLRAVWTRWE